VVRSTDRSTSGVLSDEKTVSVDEPGAGVLISVLAAQWPTKFRGETVLQQFPAPVL
jgi:hypothetical protein